VDAHTIVAAVVATKVGRDREEMDAFCYFLFDCGCCSWCWWGERKREKHGNAKIVDFEGFFGL
jgi:hypothetical protein